MQLEIHPPTELDKVGPDYGKNSKKWSKKMDAFKRIYERILMDAKNQTLIGETLRTHRQLLRLCEKRLLTSRRNFQMHTLTLLNGTNGKHDGENEMDEPERDRVKKILPLVPKNFANRNAASFAGHKQKKERSLLGGLAHELPPVQLVPGEIENYVRTRAHERAVQTVDLDALCTKIITEVNKLLAKAERDKKFNDELAWYESTLDAMYHEPREIRMAR